MKSLNFIVIEISNIDGYSIVRVQIESTTPDVTTGGSFSLAVSNNIAEAQTVGEPLKLD